MGKNRNCYFALGMESTETASVPAIDGYSVWAGDFSLSVGFYVLQDSKEMCLFCQENVIETGYDMAGFYITVNGKRMTVAVSNMQYLPDVWNNLTIVFHKSENRLCAYINGAKGFEKTVEAILQDNAAPYVVGKLFYGYISKVKCLGRALTEEEVREDTFIDPEQPERYEIYMDFTSRYPEEKGRHGLNIMLSGFADVKNLVQTVDFGTSGYIMPARSDYVEIGQFASGEFTIISKVFLKDSRSRHILVARQEQSSPYGILEGIDYTSGSPKLFVKIGDSTVVSDQELPLYQWIDIAVCYGNGRIGIYSDGILLHEQEAGTINKERKLTDFTIGNTRKSDEYKSFCGYIDAVYVFSQKKTQDQVKALSEKYPTVYSTGIEALYDCSRRMLYEDIKNVEIDLMKQAVLCLAEGTQDSVIKDNGGDEGLDGKIGDYSYWQACLIASVFIESVGTTGIRPTKGLKSDGTLTENAARQICRRVVKLPTAQKIIINYKNITGDMCRDFMQELIKCGLFDFMWNLFYEAQSNRSLIAAMFLAAAAGIVCYVAFIALIAALAGEAAQNGTNDPNSEQEDDDDDDDNVQIRLVSIRFCHNASDLSESAAFLYHGYTQSAEGTPEWEKDNMEKRKTDALYIRSEAGRVKVLVKVKIELQGEDKTYSGSIRVFSGSLPAENQSILGDLDAVHVDAEQSCEKELEFYLDNGTFSGKEIGCYQDYWSWQADECGIFASTQHHTWLLEKTPSKEWNIASEEKDKNVSLKTLEVLQRIKEYDSESAAGEKLLLDSKENWLKQMVYFIHDSQRFTYNSDRVHQYVEYNAFLPRLVFDRVRFETDFTNNSTVVLSSLDTSMVMKVFLSLLSYGTGVVRIWSNDDNESYSQYIDEKKEWVVSPPYVVFDKVILMGCGSPESVWIPNEYFAVTPDEEKNPVNPVIYDAVIETVFMDTKLDDSGNVMNATEEKVYICGLPFTDKDYEEDLYCSYANKKYYREVTTTPGNSFFIANILDDWEMSCVEEKEVPMNITAYKINGGLLAFSGRSESFNDEFKENMGVDVLSYDVLAHKISYRYINQCIQTAINNYLINENQSDFYIIMQAIIDLVFGDNVYYDVIHRDKDTKTKAEVLKLYYSIINLLKSEIDFDEKIKNYANAILQLCTCQSYFNIKKGNNRWNASIGDYLDLDKDWLFYVSDTNSLYSKDGVKNVTLSCMTGLYVSNNDCYRISKMIVLKNLLKIEPLYPVVDQMRIKAQAGGLYVDIIYALSSDCGIEFVKQKIKYPMSYTIFNKECEKLFTVNVYE